MRHAERERDENQPATPGDHADDLVERIFSDGHGVSPSSLSAERLTEEHEPNANPVLLVHAREAGREAGLPAEIVVVVQIFRVECEGACQRVPDSGLTGVGAQIPGAARDALMRRSRTRPTPTRQRGVQSRQSA